MSGPFKRETGTHTHTGIYFFKRITIIIKRRKKLALVGDSTEAIHFRAFLLLFSSLFSFQIVFFCCCCVINFGCESVF